MFAISFKIRNEVSDYIFVKTAEKILKVAYLGHKYIFLYLPEGSARSRVSYSPLS